MLAWKLITNWDFPGSPVVKEQLLKNSLSFGNDENCSDFNLVAQRIKRLPIMRETQVQSLGQEDPLEKEMATHCSTLAWKIPWTEELGRLQSMGLQRVRHNWTTSLHFNTELYQIECHQSKIWSLKTFVMISSFIGPEDKDYRKCIFELTCNERQDWKGNWFTC